MSSFSYGQHECFAKDLVTTFIVGLVKLVAGLKGLRPAPGQMGVVKTIRVGSEKAYLNDSWSYLSFDASSMSSTLLSHHHYTKDSAAWKVHFDGQGKGAYQGDATPNKPIDLGQYYYLIKKRNDEFLEKATGILT